MYGFQSTYMLLCVRMCHVVWDSDIEMLLCYLDNTWCFPNLKQTWDKTATQNTKNRILPTKLVTFCFVLNIMWLHWSLCSTANIWLISCMPRSVLYHFFLKPFKCIMCMASYCMTTAYKSSCVKHFHQQHYVVTRLFGEQTSRLRWLLFCASVLHLTSSFFSTLAWHLLHALMFSKPQLGLQVCLTTSGPHTHFTEMHGLTVRTVTYRNTCVR